MNGDTRVGQPYRKRSLGNLDTDKGLKCYAILNYAPHHNKVSWNEGIASHIFNLGITWRWVVSFMT